METNEETEGRASGTVVLGAAAPEGFALAPGFLSGPEELSLKAAIETHEENRWRPMVMRGQPSKRLVVCYGYEYGERTRGLTPTLAIPEYLRDVCGRCADAVGLKRNDLPQAIVTTYPPGAGIRGHVDAPVFGDPVIGLSLGGPAWMVFRRKGERFRIRVEPGSLYVMAGESRWFWAHEVRPVRAARISVTLRRVRSC